MTGHQDKDMPSWLAKYRRRQERAAQELVFLDDLADALQMIDITLEGFSVRLNPRGSDSVLCTVRALGPSGDPMVCFVGAETVVLTLAKMLKTTRSEEAGWKIDEYRTSG